MSHTVVLVGLGAVGAHAARQLLDTPGVEHLVVADKREDQAQRTARALGSPRVRAADLDALPRDADVVLAAVPEDHDLPLAEFAIENGLPFATVTDDTETIAQLLALEGAAVDAGVTLAAGCGFAPGLADVLAAHAAQAFDVVDEIHVARVGVAGPASAATLRRELRGKAIVAKDGQLREIRPRGHELIWFPEPMQARDCTLVGSGIALLNRAFPDATRLTVRVAEGSVPSWITRTPDDTWGAVRVEVWGRRGSIETPLIYGCVERTAVAAGTTLALTGAALAGILDLRREDAPFSGVHGLADLLEPVPFLAECHHRGIRAAAFEGLGAGAPGA